MLVVGVVVVSVLMGGILWWVHERHIRSIPDTSDERFGDYFSSHFGIEPSDALAERVQISRIIGIPPTKLGAEMRLTELIAGKLDTGAQVGLADLEFDLSALAKNAGVEGPIRMPDTVAEVIRLRLKLKTGQR
jgi:hypothetical protein